MANRKIPPLHRNNGDDGNSRIAGYVTPDLARRMRRLAAERGCSQSDLIRDAVSAYLDAHYAKEVRA